MQLTQEQFDEVFKKVALLDDIKHINGGLASIEKTLNAHTDILDGITKNTETWNAEAASFHPAMQA